MKFKANKTIILWHDGQMRVFNPTDPEPGDLPEDIIAPYIISGEAAEPDADEDASLADDAAALAEMTGAEGLTAEEVEAEAEIEAAVLADADPAPADPAPIDAPPPAAPAAPAKVKK